ncbi:MAG: carboxypeptidase regulatory-like domain-containing protein, partial [Thermoanaerobaculales bacterium]|nr:carboxypeptidase regulatory-like domain-containing protein [Thermoanaerobaculales bacterium]
MRGLGVLVVGCLIFLYSIPAIAQDTTGRMMVRTSDADAAPLPGVTVTIASPSLIGGARTGVTDERGEALFLTLGPGSYEVSAALRGFATQERTEVRVRLGSLTALNLAMPEATFAGEIEVFAETPVIDPQQIGIEQVFDADYIEKTAIGTWQRFATSPGEQSPGAVDQQFFGSIDSENAWFLDGIEVTQPSWGGLTNGAANFGIDAYDEIEVKTGGYEAEYGRALGGVTSIVMKSGGNEFSGSLDVRYQPDAFQESGVHFDPDLQESMNLAIEATLGGPIIRDRLWFFLSYYYGESESTPEGAPTTRRGKVKAPKAKLTWQISEAWRGVATYFGSEFSYENFLSSRSIMPEATPYMRREPDHLALETTGMLSDKAMWTIRGGLDRQPFDTGPMRGELEPIAHLNFATGVLSNNFFYQGWNDIDRVQAATDLTWFLSGERTTHELKAGLAVTDTGATMATCSTGTPGGVRCSADVGGLVFYDFQIAENDIPYQMIEEFTAGPVDLSSTLWSGFVQDAWRPTADLTVKAGLRYDTVRYDI